MSFYHWCSVGNVEACKLFLSNECNLSITIVNQKNEWMETPLHYAAANGCYDVCELLLRHGADVNAKNKNGFTPLFEASVRGIFKPTAHKFPKVCELLLAHGADYNAKSHCYGSPLDVAENPDIKDLLTRHATFLRRKEIFLMCEFDFLN